MNDDEPLVIFLARAYGWSPELDADAVGLWMTVPGEVNDCSKLVHIPTPKNWCYISIRED